MNKNVIKSLLIPSVRSINELEEEEFDDYKDKYFKKHSELLSRTYHYFERKRIAQDNFIVNVFFGIPAIEKPGMVLYPSDIKFGHKPVYIPVEFECLMRSVLLKDLKISGLFRKPPLFENTKNCINEYIDLLKETNDTQILIEMLDKYEVLALTSVFKTLFEWYEHTIFPQCFIPTYVRITSVQNEEEVLTVVRSLVMGLPRTNRHLLEAILKFIIMVHKISTDSGADHNSKMNLKGFSVVMMPNLFLKGTSKIDLAEVGQLVKLAEFILNNTSEIFEVEEI